MLNDGSRRSAFMLYRTCMGLISLLACQKASTRPSTRLTARLQIKLPWTNSRLVRIRMNLSHPVSANIRQANNNRFVAVYIDEIALRLSRP